MIDKKMIARIQEEVAEDLGRYDGDYDEWSEIAMDCPSNTLVEIIGELPDDEQEEGWKVAQAKVRSLGR